MNTEYLFLGHGDPERLKMIHTEQPAISVKRWKLISEGTFKMSFSQSPTGRRSENILAPSGMNFWLTRDMIEAMASIKAVEHRSNLG